MTAVGTADLLERQTDRGSFLRRGIVCGSILGI